MNTANTANTVKSAIPAFNRHSVFSTTIGFIRHTVICGICLKNAKKRSSRETAKKSQKSGLKKVSWHDSFLKKKLMGQGWTCWVYERRGREYSIERARETAQRG